MRWLFDRPTREAVMIVLVLTICAVLLGTLVASVAYIFLNPNANILSASNFIGDMTNTLVGLLAGYLAGRSELVGRGGDDDPGPDRPPPRRRLLRGRGDAAGVDPGVAGPGEGDSSG